MDPLRDCLYLESEPLIFQIVWAMEISVVLIGSQHDFW